MARALRIEYPGAVYHLMARGNQGEPIFDDDKDRRCFLETLGETCEKTGWRVHAYVLMGNHYHLLAETCEGNLVAGMKWLQSTYTLRYNSRHKVRGHLFQGRYKAIAVEGDDDYFRMVSTYIHMNPARAGLIRIGEERLKRYRWSSYPWYLTRGGKGPAWLRRDRVMGSLGLAVGQGRAYEAYMDGRVLELVSKAGRKELDEEWKGLRRGWYVGGGEFLGQLQERMEQAVKGRLRESHSGRAKQLHGEAAAERWVAAGMKVLGLDARGLENLEMGALEKVAMAWLVRERTTVPLRWVSGRLGMGHYTRVTQAVSRMRRRPGRKLRQMRRKLARLGAELP
jgi:putative transposase